MVFLVVFGYFPELFKAYFFLSEVSGFRSGSLRSELRLFQRIVAFFLAIMCKAFRILARVLNSKLRIAF